MTTLEVDSAAVRRQADLLEGVADLVRSVRIEVPEVGEVNGQTSNGLALVEHRAATLADQLSNEAAALRSIAFFLPVVDDSVASSLLPRGS